jgi:hypothetical protein
VIALEALLKNRGNQKEIPGKEIPVQFFLTLHGSASSHLEKQELTSTFVLIVVHGLAVAKAVS